MMFILFCLFLLHYPHIVLCSGLGINYYYYYYSPSAGNQRATAQNSEETNNYFSKFWPLNTDLNHVFFTTSHLRKYWRCKFRSEVCLSRLGLIPNVKSGSNSSFYEPFNIELDYLYWCNKKLGVIPRFKNLLTSSSIISTGVTKN